MRSKTVAGVYKLSFQTGEFYIGSSNDCKVRRRDHLGGLKYKRHRNERLQDAFERLGGVQFSMLFECRVDDLIFYEQRAIDIMGPSLNISRVAGRLEQNEYVRLKRANTLKGRRKSEEHRARLCEAWKNRAPDSDETRAKKSASSKGKPKGEAQRKRMAEAAKARPKASGERLDAMIAQCHKNAQAIKGLPMAAEQSAKISAALKGRTFSEESRRKMSESARARWSQAS